MIYQKPIIIHSFNHLEKMVELGNYYRTLPTLSNAVDAALLNSHKFTANITKNCLKLLSISAELRNKLLFRESLVHSTGPWETPQYLDLTDPVSKKICDEAYKKIHVTIMSFTQRMLLYMTSSTAQTVHEECSKMLFECAQGCRNESMDPRESHNTFNLPRYLRNIERRVGLGFVIVPLETLKPLLQSKLVLDRSGFYAGGSVGSYMSSFLCTEIRDEDLPWDVNQIVW